jgi:hypothetical protein
MESALAVELKREKELNKSESRAPTDAKLRQSIKQESGDPADRLPKPSEWVSNQASNQGLNSLSPSHQVSFGDAVTIAPAALSDDIKGLNAIQDGTGTPSAHHNSETDLYTTISSFSPTSSSGFNHTFGSETTSLEYSILSSMLNGIDPAWLSGSPDDQGADSGLGRVLDSTSSTTNNGAFSHMGINGMPWQLTGDDTSSWQNSALSQDVGQVEPLHHMNPTINSDGAMNTNNVAAYDALEVPSPVGAATSGLDLTGRNGTINTPSNRAAYASVRQAQNSNRAAAAAAGQDKIPDEVWKERVKHIYSDQMKVFPYTEGYHFLIKYITAK